MNVTAERNNHVTEPLIEEAIVADVKESRALLLDESLINIEDRAALMGVVIGPPVEARAAEEVMTLSKQDGPVIEDKGHTVKTEKMSVAQYEGKTLDNVSPRAEVTHSNISYRELAMRQVERAQRGEKLAVSAEDLKKEVAQEVVLTDKEHMTIAEMEDMIRKDKRLAEAQARLEIAFLSLESSQTPKAKGRS